VQVVQIPCPILPERRKFDLALQDALALVPPAARHAVTMTGELSDVFANRAEGVAYLVAMMCHATGESTLFYGGRAGFLDADAAIERQGDVASANWHASATFAARHYPDALLIDIGTTTTDLIPLKGGAVAAQGYTDGERLTEGELVYAGVVRTPVMAIAQDAPFRDRTQRIAAERFATMADVFRLTGDLPGDADPYPPADLRGKSFEESAARLARMLGRDAGEAPPDAWVALADHFAERLLDTLDGAARGLIGREARDKAAPVIGAGCGRFLAGRLAERLDRPYRGFAEAVDCAQEAREMAASAAAAVAVALLAV
jgi:(4-(4-[2-(gamma-L-glutamylamino)ethyl]phenoxymethyl)furan-2-yl)methanamine synthase